MANKTRLDMKHGFMKSIIRNQVDRDNYDKEVKAQQDVQKLKQSKPKKPDLQTYIPAPKRQNENRPPLFRFEFQDQHNKVHGLFVKKGDDPCEIANNLGRICDLKPTMIMALIEFLRTEMNKRTNPS